MTREMKHTSVYLALAGVMLAIAVFPLGGSAPVAMGQQGKRFFPEFDDFTKAVVLEVVDYVNGEPQAFKVEFKNGLWRIPSRYNYPADAKDKLGKVAAAVMTLERTVLRSTKLEDQAKFGVVDPLDEDSKKAEGRGRRITLRDADENVLASLIISKPKEKKKDDAAAADDKDPLGLPEGHQFVRAADETEIYSAKLDLELSTDFQDWIDTDVLDLAVADISTITLARYKVDESQLPGIAIQGGPTSVLMQKDSEWTVEGQKPDQQAAVAAIDSMTEGLRNLKIVDVRPFENDLRSMVSVGIFPTKEKVYGNEGELQVETKDGLIYVLFFGEEAPGSKAKEPRRFLLVRTAPNPTVMASITDPKKKKEVELKANMLAKRFQGWYYVISAKSFNDLRPKPELLVEKKEDDGHTEDDGHGHGAKPEGDGLDELGFPPLIPKGVERPKPDGTGAPDDTGPPPPEKKPEDGDGPKTPEDEKPEDGKTPEDSKPDNGKQPADPPPPVPPEAKTPEQPKEENKGGDGKPGDPPKDGQ